MPEPLTSSVTSNDQQLTDTMMIGRAMMPHYYEGCNNTTTIAITEGMTSHQLPVKEQTRKADAIDNW